MRLQPRNVMYSFRTFMLACLVTVSCCLLPGHLTAAELVDFTLTQKQGVYKLSLEIILDASPESVHDVVTDYVHIYRLNPSIIDSEVLPSEDESAVRVRTVLNDCILIFCKEVHRVEEVRELGKGNIYANIVPELSNIKSGITIWQIQPMGGRTRIYYSLRLEPDFFVPPLIGTHLVKQKMKREVLLSLDNIERIANVLANKLKAGQ